MVEKKKVVQRKPRKTVTSASQRQGKGAAPSSETAKRKHMEKALPQSEERYKSIVETSLDGIYQVDTSGKFLFVNESFARTFGYRREEIIDRHFSSLLSEKAVPRIAEMVNKVFSGENVKDETHVVHKDGHEVPVSFTATPLREQGKIVGLTGILKDISRLKQVEQELAESEEWHRALVETAGKAGYGITILQNTPEQEAAVIFANSEATKILGLSQQEALEISAWDLFEPSELAEIQQRYIQRQEGQQVISHYEAALLHKDGRRIPVEASLSLMNYKGKAATVIHFKDITERKRVEQELHLHRQHLEELVSERNAELRKVNEQLQQELTERKQAELKLQKSEEYHRALIENAVDGIAILDADGTIRYESPSYERLLGFKPEERIGGNLFERIHPDDITRVARLFSEFLQNLGGTIRAEVRAQHKDGVWRYVEAIGSNLIDNPVVKGIVVNFRDVTERKEAADKLQQLYEKEKVLRQQLETEMKRRVEFSRALAHELKTPLTPMLISSQVLASELKEGPLRSLARNINKGALNLDGRIDELLDIAKGEVGLLRLQTQSFAIAPLLEEVVEYVTPMTSMRSQSLILELPDSLPRIKADKVRVRQVVMNLLNNAFKFTPDGSKITLRALNKNDSLVIEVEDNGPGMEIEGQQHLFEPYYPTGAHEEHLSSLGLGLALCKMLVQLHGGQIWAKSQPGKGSTFSFSLPLEATNNERKVSESGDIV